MSCRPFKKSRIYAHTEGLSACRSCVARSYGLPVVASAADILPSSLLQCRNAETPIVATANPNSRPEPTQGQKKRMARGRGGPSQPMSLHCGLAIDSPLHPLHEPARAVGIKRNRFCEQLQSIVNRITCQFRQRLAAFQPRRLTDYLRRRLRH